MANSEQTKRALAEGLKTALRSQEFDQITVADITECSEVSRNTFYYHFRGKQELVDWIFHTDLGPVLRDSRPGRTWNEALTELLARLQRSRVFYAGILRNQGQDRFSSCLFEDCSQMVSSLLARRPGELSLAENRRWLPGSMPMQSSDWQWIGFAATPRRNLKRLSPCCRS